MFFTFFHLLMSSQVTKWISERSAVYYFYCFVTCGGDKMSTGRNENRFNQLLQILLLNVNRWKHGAAHVLLWLTNFGLCLPIFLVLDKSSNYWHSIVDTTPSAPFDIFSSLLFIPINYICRAQRCERKNAFVLLGIWAVALVCGVWGRS